MRTIWIGIEYTSSHMEFELNYASINLSNVEWLPE